MYNFMSQLLPPIRCIPVVTKINCKAIFIIKPYGCMQHRFNKMHRATLS